MSDIEFEGTDSQHWATVKDGVLGLARDHLQNRVNAIHTGADGFRRDANQLIHEAITKPPGRVFGLTELLEVASKVCELILPEEGAVAEVYQAAKSAWENLKPGYELNNKVNEKLEANSVEDATKHLGEVVDAMCEDISSGADEIKLAAEDKLESALTAYVTQNLQVFRPGDQAYYQTLSDAIGVSAVHNHQMLVDETVNRAMQSFRPKVMEIAAAMHFFHEMSDDAERLNFLIDDVAEKGTDPDQFLRLIGADQAYWDQFLAAYRSGGKTAAMEALTAHLMGG